MPLPFPVIEPCPVNPSMSKCKECIYPEPNYYSRCP